MHPSGVIGRRFRFRPFVQHVPFHGIETAVHLWRVGVDGQFQPMAVRIEEVNGFENRVVGHAHDIDAIGLQARPGFQEIVDTFNLERQMLDPLRCIGILARWYFTVAYAGRRKRDRCGFACRYTEKLFWFLPR